MFHSKGFRFEIVFLLVVLPGLLIACGGEATLEPTTIDVPTTSPSSTPTLPSIAIATEFPAPAGLIVTVSDGTPPTLDGTMSAEEWSDAKLERFSDGSELLLKHHDGYLYLGIRAKTPGMIVGNIFVDHGDRVLILHSSAALGTAVYEKRSDGWDRTQDFVWRCRNSGDSPSAQAAREAFFQEEDWLADISYMGVPEELEYKIAMPDGSLRLAVTFTPASDVSVRVYWPPALADDCVVAPQGEFPTTMQFSPSTWATVTAANQEVNAPAETIARHLDLRFASCGLP